MPEEVKIQEEQKNTVATVGMWFSIIGLIALITVFLAWLGLPMLFIGFILGIVGLFYKPKTRARIAVIIPLIVFIALVSVAYYIGKSVKTPTNEFIDRAKPQLEQLESENFDGDRFGDILEVEVNKTVKNISEDEWKVMFDASTGSNFLEKGSYLFFSIVRQSMETALEKYNNGEIAEIDEEDDDNIIDVDIDIEDDENDIDDEDDDIDDDIEETEQQKETVVVQPKKSNNETFSQNEKNDIAEILDILE